jgi:hypothetical protein
MPRSSVAATLFVSGKTAEAAAAINGSPEEAFDMNP